MKYWLHRISHHAEASWPLLDKGVLTIGFSDLSNDAFLKKAMSAREVSDWDTDVKSAYGGLLRSRHSLWRFLKGMSDVDLVLVPGLVGSRTYSVYRIDGGPRLVSDIQLNGVETWQGAKVTKAKYGLLEADGALLDLGFYRQVSVHSICGRDAKDISRSDYADSALTARMKLRGTNADISDLKRNLDNALRAYGKEEPLRIYSHAINEIAPKLLSSIQEQLGRPEKLEELVKWYFERLGANARIPPKKERSKEGDADVIAVLDSLRLTIYVQAKFHGGRTDTEAVRQVIEYARWKKEKNSSEHAVALWVISTAKNFTRECRKQAEEAEVVLVSGPEFARMLLNAGLERLDL